MSVVDERKLFVAGLAEVVTEDVLRQLFEAAGGAVDEVSIPRDRSTGKPRGFGFVTMASEAGATAARESLDGTIQAGRSMSVRHFRPDRSSPPPSRTSNAPPASESTLYLGNLPFDATPQDVEELFREAGFDNVTRVHLPTDADRRPRGFGFVTLASAEAARAAAEQMQLAAMRGRSLSVSIARSRGAPTPSGRSAPRPPRATPPAGPVAPREGVGFRQPPPPSVFTDEPPPASWDDGGRGTRREKEGRKKEKKRKARLASSERSRRRKNEGFRAPRSRGLLDEGWDDD